jgi:hypothetical protein
MRVSPMTTAAASPDRVTTTGARPRYSPAGFDFGDVGVAPTGSSHQPHHLSTGFTRLREPCHPQPSTDDVAVAQQTAAYALAPPRFRQASQACAGVRPDPPEQRLPNHPHHHESAPIPVPPVPNLSAAMPIQHAHHPRSVQYAFSPSATRREKPYLLARSLTN